MKRRRFTLIELLVVIAIIGILMSILLPALGRARAMAKLATCLSNTKQFGVASQLYLVSNDYKMARGAEGSDYARSFGRKSQGVPFIRMAEYLGLESVYDKGPMSNRQWYRARDAYYNSSEIFRCPGKEYKANYLLDYAVNSLHYKEYYSSGRSLEGGYGSVYGDEIPWPTKYLDTNLNETILFADNYRRPDLRGNYSGPGQFWAPSHVPFRSNAPNVNPAYARMMVYADNTHLQRLAMTAFDGSGKVLSLKNAGDWPDHKRVNGDWD